MAKKPHHVVNASQRYVFRTDSVEELEADIHSNLPLKGDYEIIAEYEIRYLRKETKQERELRLAQLEGRIAGAEAALKEFKEKYYAQV